MEIKDPTDRLVDAFTDEAAAKVELAAWAAALEHTGWSQSLGVYLIHNGHGRHELMMGRHDGAAFPAPPAEARKRAQLYRAYLIRGDDLPSPQEESRTQCTAG